MFENKVRTVPPRPKSWRLLCLLVLPLLLSRSLRVWAHFSDPYQGLFLWRYVKDAIRVTLHLGGKHALADYLSLHDFYYHAGALWILRYPLAVDAVLMTALYLWLRHIDYKEFNKLRRDGRQISGPVLHAPKSFEKTVKGDGVSIGVARSAVLETIARTGGKLIPAAAREWIRTPRSSIHIPRAAEKEHFAVSGAPGSGKTTEIQWIVDSLMERSEREGRKVVFVFFDPHGSYIRRYGKPGDWVGNPYDVRGFSWCPTWELDLNREKWSKARALAMARSIYTGKQKENAVNSSSEFFTRSSQLLFSHLVLKHQPTEAQELASWMDNPESEIETRVTGKLATDLDHGSMGQRNGILSSFTMPQQAFEAIPMSGYRLNGTWHKNAPCWTARDWCLQRDRNIFLTSTADTIDALQPLHSMWIDMIFRQIISMGERPNLPEIVIVIDEADAAQRLPTLQKAVNQIRKFGATIILGFQSRSQLVDVYGEEEATAILAAMKTQIYHRTGEEKSAKWQAGNIGEIEFEELHESWSGSGMGKQERQVSTQLKRKFLLKPSDFMGLKDRESILRFENEVVRYRVALSPFRQNENAFVPRSDSPVTKGIRREPEPKEKPAKEKTPKEPKAEVRSGSKKAKKHQPEENETVLIGVNVTTQGDD
jgi:hypothetical protein